MVSDFWTPLYLCSAWHWCCLRCFLLS